MTNSKNVINKVRSKSKNREHQVQSRRDEIAVVLKKEKNLWKFQMHSQKFGDLYFRYESIDYNYRSLRSWSVDFDGSFDGWFLEKNKSFFVALDQFDENEYVPITFITDWWKMEYYSLIQFTDKLWEEHIMPTPVFLSTINNKNLNIKKHKDENNFSEFEYPDIDFFKKYIKDNYSLLVDKQIDKDEYLTDIEEKEKKSHMNAQIDRLKKWEEIPQQDINSLISYLLREDTKNIFNYQIPAKNIIAYVFTDTYHHSDVMKYERAEEVLGEELRKFYKKEKNQKLHNYAYYWNLWTWAMKYASDELENRFEKIEIFDLIEKWGVINNFPLKWDWSPDAVVLWEEWKKEYRDYIREGHGGNTRESDSNVDTKFIKNDDWTWKKLVIFYKETPENVAKISQEKKEFEEVLANFREKFWNDMVIVEYNRAAWYITYNNRWHSVYDDKFAMDSMLKGKQPYDTCYVVPWGRWFRTGWSDNEFEDINEQLGVNPSV